MHPKVFAMLFEYHKVQGEMDENRLGGDIPMSAVVANASCAIAVRHTESILMMYEWGKLQSEYMEDYYERTWFSERVRRAYEKGELKRPSAEELKTADCLHFLPTWTGLDGDASVAVAP